MMETTASGSRPAEGAAAAEDSTIRPFRIGVPEEDLVELRRRILATRWPERETVADPSQGVQLATMQELARYWGSDYDFRRFEARLNALPQFLTEIDGLDIHFIHVRSPHGHALPLIITHGWPGSVIEMLNVVGPLTDPAAHGGDAEDAFDVVVPSMPAEAVEVAYFEAGPTDGEVALLSYGSPTTSTATSTWSPAWSPRAIGSSSPTSGMANRPPQPLGKESS